MSEPSWQSWESRWAEYLDQLEAAERRREDEENDQDPELIPVVEDFVNIMPGGFGSAAKARQNSATPRRPTSARSTASNAGASSSKPTSVSTGAWKCTFCSHEHDEASPYCLNCAKFRPSASAYGPPRGQSHRGPSAPFPKPRAPEVKQPEVEPVEQEQEPDYHVKSEPRRQPRRPQPPGWEAKKEELDREAEERQRQNEERRRQAEQKADRQREERKRQQEQRESHERAREQQREEERSQERQEQRERQQRRQSWQQQQQPPPPRQQHQRPSSARGSAPSSAPPPRKAPPQPKLGRFFDSFGAFESAFAEWEAASASVEVIKLSEVPFPPFKDPAGLVEAGLLRGGDLAKRKKLLRTALLRWHPDKWMAVTNKIEAKEHGELGRRLATITQALVEQKDL